MQSETRFFDLDTFNPKNYFKEYHFFENFSPSNEYRKGLFLEDFDKGYGKLQYRNVKHIIYHTSPKKEEEKEKDFKELIKIKKDNKRRKMVFVVAKEVLTKEERDKLIPYCQCSKCLRYSFNPIKYMICECCVGCLKVEEEYYTRQYMINKAREYRDNYSKSYSHILS